VVTADPWCAAARFWLLLWPFIVLNVAGFAYHCPRTGLRARLHHLLNKVLGMLLLASVALWLVRLVVEEWFVRGAVSGVLDGVGPGWRAFAGWIVASAVVAGLWVVARFQARRHGSLDGLGATPAARPSLSEWWADRPSPLSDHFWRRGSGERREANDVTAVLIFWAVIALAWSLAASNDWPAGSWKDGSFGLEPATGWLIWGQFTVLALILGLSLIDWMRSRHRLPSFLRALAPFLLAAASVLGVYVTGAVLALPFGSGKRALPESWLLEPVLRTSLIALGTVPIAAVVWVFTGHPGGDPNTGTRRWRRKVGRFTRLALLASSAEVVLAVPIVAATVAAVVALIGAPVPEVMPPPGPWRALAWIPVAIVLIVAVVPRVRERLGVIWDVLVFWPRVNSQLAPPPYAARAVPEVANHVADLVSSGNDVLLLCHSQGSVIGYPALARLTDDVRQHATMTTYGSPLGVLFARFFPAYFRPGDYATTRTTLRPVARATGWRNFYRPTDYIGRSVFDTAAGTADDPADVQIPLAPPGVATHSGYLDEPLVRAWIQDWSRPVQGT
jgi:hypothetical protein